MTRDDIYEHLAQVYLGKKEKTRKEPRVSFNAWLVINILITVVVFASASYGLSAYLSRRGNALKNKVIYALNNGPIRINYDLAHPYPSVKAFAVTIPEMNAGKYRELQFAARGTEAGSPGVMRVEVRNDKNEVSSFVVNGVDAGWKKFSVPFDDFYEITDWSQIKTISFVLEAWNVRKTKGVVLIDEVCFSG